jgi:hypothetical protein
LGRSATAQKKAAWSYLLEYKEPLSCSKEIAITLLYAIFISVSPITVLLRNTANLSLHTLSRYGGGSGDKVPLNCNLGNRAECSASHLGRLTPGKSPRRTPLKGQDGLRNRSDVAGEKENLLTLPGTEPPYPLRYS